MSAIKVKAWHYRGDGGNQNRDNPKSIELSFSKWRLIVRKREKKKSKKEMPEYPHPLSQPPPHQRGHPNISTF